MATVDLPILEIKELSKNFGNFKAVDRVSFNLNKGEIVCFIGPNGAGKTTTIKMIIGLIIPSQGEILIHGKPLKEQGGFLKNRLGYMSQRFSLYPLLTGLENIVFFGGMAGKSDHFIRTVAASIKNQLTVDYLSQRVADIPPGIRQRIALSISLLKDPEMLLLDEPTSGVDPELRRRFWLDIYRLKTEGKTVLVSTHNLDEVEYADRVIIIHQGKVIGMGEPPELQNQYHCRSVEELFKLLIGRHEAH